MSDFIKFLLKAYLRKVLTILGTFLLTHGVLTPSEADSFVAAHLEEIVGALLVGGSTVWTHIYQLYVRRKVLTAKALPPETTSAELEAAVKSGLVVKAA